MKNYHNTAFFSLAGTKEVYSISDTFKMDLGSLLWVIREKRIKVDRIERGGKDEERVDDS